VYITRSGDFGKSRHARPYDFNPDKIDEVVTERSAGNYALGHITPSGELLVRYVGRSDIDLNKELKARSNLRDDSFYHQFSFSYAPSPKAAFEKECRNFHDFGGSEWLHNEIHPARPDGTNLKCTVCNVFG